MTGTRAPFLVLGALQSFEHRETSDPVSGSPRDGDSIQHGWASSTMDVRSAPWAGLVTGGRMKN